MTLEQIKAVYEIAKATYDKKIRLVDAKKIISEKFSVNKNSFADYYRAFQKMLDGELHTRSISSNLRNYYLDMIYKHYGPNKLKIALDAYMDSIIYYEETHNTNMITERNIHKHFNDILSK